MSLLLATSTAPSLALLDEASVTGEWMVLQFPGRYCLSVAGTFGGAAVGLQLKGPDGTTPIDIEDDAGAISITAAKALAVLLPAGEYRGKITGGDGVSLSASLDKVSE